MSHRILHIAASLDRYSSAADMLAVVAALGQPGSMHQLEHHVVILGRRGPLVEAFDTAGVPLVHLDRRWTCDPTTLARLVHHLRAVRPALVHTWDAASQRYSELALPWAGDPLLVAQWGDAGRGRHRGRWPVPGAWRHAPNRFVVASDSIRRRLQQQLGPDIPCSIIPPAATTVPASTTTRGELLQQLNLPAEAKLIAVAGPLLPRYGVKELIWAADMVRVLHPDMRLLIVGDGPQRHHLERFARTAAEPANICFLGDTPQWPDILSHLDVYWQGTETAATSPTTLLDAMAAGVPVVASRVPQHAEWIEHEKTGYLVDIADRAARTRVTDHLLTEISTARAIGNAARDLAARHFSLTTRAENLAALYAELLG